ncbi:tetratricopeptide repeat protein [Streptomyces sp. NPDC008079]|uniref:tetratricopeptide repeat protein n=1 Tax=Streptomyces sp. NPDC008079 TaxID=3364806 RepID=UPI0036EA5D7E
MNPAGSGGYPASSASIEGQASGQGRVYQAARDQLITEHHHHYSQPSSDNPWPGPDSVRVALAERAPKILRNRSSLRAALTAAIGEGHGIHVVHGMGGCGKTSLAFWAFHEALEQGRIALWVSASDRVTLRAGMLAVAADRGADPGEVAAAQLGQRAAADLVWHYLDRSLQPWLLVIDNADEPAVLDEGGWLRASAAGTVLVTSRRSSATLWRGASLHQLDVLPLDDAAQVLCDLAPDAGSLQDAKTVARRLGCLPLALNLAGTYLAHQLLESWTMSDYHDRLQEEDAADLIDQGAQVQDSRHLISRTWQISLENLSTQGLPEAATLLRLLSCWASDPLPLTVFASNAINTVDLESLEPPLHARQLEPALRGLLDHSLATMHQRSDGTRCVQVHGLLLEGVYSSIPVEHRPGHVSVATNLLRAVAPAQDTTSVDAEQLRLITPHVTALLHHVDEATVSPAVELSVQVAQCIHEMGDYAAAIALTTLSGDTSQRLQGATHPDTLTARHQQGDSLRRVGRLADAEQLLRRVHEKRTEVLGGEHPDTLRTAALVSLPLYLLGRHDESLTWLGGAIDGQRRVLGEDHVDTLKSRALSLEFLAETGHTDAFVREGPDTVATCERALGPEHPVTVIAYSNYALGLLHTAAPEEAETAARRAVEARIRLHGVDHPLVYSAKLVLSWALMLGGQHDEAVAMMREAVAGRERLLGPEHPLTTKARILLAERLAAADQHEEARQLLHENLPAAEGIYGLNDPDLVRIRRLRSG